MSMRSDLSSAEDAANEALLVISTLRMTLEAMQADERVALIRRLEEYGDRIGISALMKLERELSSAASDLFLYATSADDDEDEKAAEAESATAE